jgi:hypothetical protein
VSATDTTIHDPRRRRAILAAVVDGVPNSLATLVYDATRGDPAQRIGSVAQFRADLDKVWDELTAPEPEPVVDPLKAHKGDRLDGGLSVVRRLGTGATATALLVKTDDGRELVLKVARDEQHAERLAAEARALGEAGALAGRGSGRLGRTGRRTGTTRNCLLFALDHRSLIEAAGLLCLWGSGWVEPIVAPPEPRHIVAQQMLALCLQEHRIGDKTWSQWWNDLKPFGPSAQVVVRYLADNGYLDTDNGILFIGPAAELAFGRRHFMDMTAVFTGSPNSPC